MGKPLAEWLPDLPTSYHYPVNISEFGKEKAKAILERYRRPITLVSCASYRGAEAWKTWKYPEWSYFLSHMKEELSGGTIVMVGGFWDDLTASFEDDGYPCIVGKTAMPTMLELLRQADYYVGFSSGMGVMRTVFKRNAFMLWPDHQVALSTSWAPPEMMENDQYVAVLWREPEMIFKRWRVWLKKNS
jgi:ADP-heptose:LPS heptosyltransferase